MREPLPPLNFSRKDYPLLHQVQENGHIRFLGLGRLDALAAELRRSLMETVGCTGGHLASNLGVVELTIALHYVFDSPRDAFLWDVGHQAYVHKMLSGRWRDFGRLRQQGGLSGFPRRDESLHDYLNSGHAGTAISAGLGLELGRSLDGNGHKVLCIVGDASLTSGMAFEAMNHCGHQPNRLAVVMNDNEMSIAPNVGAVSRILSRLTAGHSYVFLRDRLNQVIRRIPLLGEPAYRALLRFKGAVKKAVYRNNLFTEFGFKYIGPIDGHNVPMLIDALQRVAQLDEPVFLHVRTQKGKGLKEAEEAPAKYHGISPPAPPGMTFTESFRKSLMKREASCAELVCISAAMAGSTGLQGFAERHPSRFFDFGIAEQHAITLACGLALAGKLPLVAIYSTFMQRALDQLIHDASLMRLPLILVCDRAGIVPGDGDTHQGIYDIAQFRSIMGLELYSPGTDEEVDLCLAYALQRGQRELEAQQKRAASGQHDFRSGPVVLRLPKRACPAIQGNGVAVRGDEPPSEPLLEFFPSGAEAEGWSGECGAKVLLICSGSLLPEALGAQKELDGAVDLVQLCRLAPLPASALLPYLRFRYRAIFCIEDGVLSGGVGQELLSLAYTCGVPVYLRGIEGSVPQMGSYGQLLEVYGLDSRSLVAWVRECLA
ncbi:MAG: 1-deoxy-D-xylulose-5-phosphate synthase [Spirochaetota bacterium]